MVSMMPRNYDDLRAMEHGNPGAPPPKRPWFLDLLKNHGVNAPTCQYAPGTRVSTEPGYLAFNDKLDHCGARYHAVEGPPIVLVP